jgi:hypothetical protein
VKISGPPDVVGIVPHLVGFTPTESLVLVGLHGRRQRTGITLRFDLPSPEREAELVTEAVVRVAHGGADDVIVACYSSETPDAGDLPRRALVVAVISGCLDARIGVVDALLVREGRWYSYTCTSECCPRSGTPLPDPASGAGGRFAAEAVGHGRVLMPSRKDLEASVRAPVARRSAELEQRFRAADAALATERGDGGADLVRQRTVTMVVAAVHRRASGQGELTDDQAARVVVGLGDVHARDDIATMPIDERDALVDVLSDLARRTPDGRAAPVCSVLAWVAYQNGNGALTNVALARALGDEPTYGLAVILDQAVQRQIHPEHIRELARHVQRALHPRPLRDRT